MITDTTLASEYATKPDEWRVEHVTAPKTSCLDRARICLRLRELMPEDADAIGGYLVLRKMDGYRIFDPRKRLSYQDALKAIEWRNQVVSTVGRVQMELPLFSLAGQGTPHAA